MPHYIFQCLLRHWRVTSKPWPACGFVTSLLTFGTQYAGSCPPLTSTWPCFCRTMHLCHFMPKLRLVKEWVLGGGGSWGNESECGTNKLCGSRMICLFFTPIHSPMNPKKRHSFLIFTHLPKARVESCSAATTLASYVKNFPGWPTLFRLRWGRPIKEDAYTVTYILTSWMIKTCMLCTFLISTESMAEW